MQDSNVVPAPNPADGSSGCAISSTAPAGSNADVAPAMLCVPSASSTAAPPLLRGPPPSDAEVAVGVDMPPAPPEVSELVPVSSDQSALVPLPLAPAMEVDIRPPDQSMPYQAPEVARKPQSCRWRAWACLRRLPFGYCETVARFPWAFLILYAVVVVIVISSGWQEVAVNTDIEAFREVAGDAATHHRSYNEALKFQNTVKDAGDLAHRTTFEVQLFYEAKKGSVFSESSLRDIRALENLLRNLKGWKTMCAMSDVNARFRCEPGESLGNYAWPGRKEVKAGDHTPFTLSFDGASRERLPVDAFLTYLSEGQPHDLRKFLPQQSGVSQADSTVLRTIFAFTAPSLDDGTFTTAYKTFVDEELFSALQNATERAEEEPDDPWIEPWSVRVYFRGKEIQDHEVRYYLTGDLQLAIGALVLTYLVTYLQLRSLFLASVGMLQVCMVPLMAFSVVGKKELSLAGFLCIFLVIGLSSNDLLAIKEYWIRVGRECAEHYPPVTGNKRIDKGDLDLYYGIRLSRTFQALLFRFLPQLMAMVSWLTMLHSEIRPIREFGLFMFTCTLFACFLCVGVFPPLLVLHEAYIQPFITKRMHRTVAMVLEPSTLRFPWRPVVRQLLKLATRRTAKFVWAGVAAVVLVIILPWTIVKAVYSDNPGLPEVYSSGHHGSVGRPLIAAFVPASPALVMASNNTLVCDPSASGAKGCGLHWCEAPKAAPTSSSSTPAPSSRPTECICHRPSLTSCAKFDYINFTSSLAGNAFTKTSDINRLNSLKNYAKAAFRVPAQSISFPGGEARVLSSLVMEHWESGMTNVEPMVEMPVAFIRMKATNSTPNRYNTCGFAQTCYCGARICVAGKGFVTEPSKIVLPAPTTTTLPKARLLSERNTPAPSSKEVIVVFGLTAPTGDGLLEGDTSWSRDATFEPVSPWAQRSMLKICTNVPSGFNVLQSNCWIQGFRTWMISQGQKFPTQRFGDFQGNLRRFLKEANSLPVTAMWLDAKGDMFATAFAFKVPANLQASSADVLASRDKWLAYVKAENEDSATSASKAWATSSFWVEAEAQNEAYTNAWELAGIAISICVAACLLYTWDFAFTGIVILVSTVSMTVLAWFMFSWFQWAIGPWEVVLLVAYMMYIVEPALRVGRGAIWGDFLHSEARIAGNAVKAVVRLQMLALAHTPVTVLALTDDSQADRGVASNAPASETSSVDSPPHQREEVAEDSEHRKAFEARMHQYIMYVTNATFGSAAKLFLCGILALPCEFRLFTRMGAVTMMVALITIPFTFILVPTALVLMPIREEPDIVTLLKYARAEYHRYRDA